MRSDEDARDRDLPPIDRVVLRDERDGKDTRHVEAAIDNQGDLVLSGQDLGPKVQAFFRTHEYEYFYNIPANYKDTLLLRLLEEKFKPEFLFDDWLKAHGIPYEFSNWYSPD